MGALSVVAFAGESPLGAQYDWRHDGPETRPHAPVAAKPHKETIQGRPFWTGTEEAKASARVTMEGWVLQPSVDTRQSMEIYSERHPLLGGLAQLVGGGGVFAHLYFGIHDAKSSIYVHGFNIDPDGNRLEAFDPGGTLKMVALTPRQSEDDRQRHGHRPLPHQALDSVQVGSSAQLLGRILDLGAAVNRADIPYHMLLTNSNGLAAAVFNIVQPGRTDCSTHSCPALLAAGGGHLVPGVDSGIAAKVGKLGRVYESLALSGVGMIDLASRFNQESNLQILANLDRAPVRAQVLGLNT